MAAATTAVRTQGELERALYAKGEMLIKVKKNITVSYLLRVRGKKTISGENHRICRKVSASGIYRGSLIVLQGESLRLQQVTLGGGGKNAGFDGNINGRLIECTSGKVILGRGSRLVENYNLTSLTDGGGGVTVHSGGELVMEEGSQIRDNLSITGGSGVRVDAGGLLQMKGGSICENAVVGQREDTDFDGRGGGIHNRGRVLLQGGEVSGNIARGYTKGGQGHGGYGGAVYNMGVLKISGGILRQNSASYAGGAIYTNESSEVTLLSGEISKNSAVGQRGGGIYLSAAARVSVKGGKICDNEADDGSQIFLSSTASGSLEVEGGIISGSKAAIYNNGSIVRISGGTIRSSHCALKNKGTCRISGGILSGDSYGVWQGGVLHISGDVIINRCYLCDDRTLTTEGTLTGQKTCELWPESYEEGKKLVSITSGQEEKDVLVHFTLKKKGRYFLEAGAKGLYIQRKHYMVQFEANGGTGMMAVQKIYVGETMPLMPGTFSRENYGFVGWATKPIVVTSKDDIQYKDETKVYNLGKNGETVTLYALWVKRPLIKNEREKLVFYENESVTKEVLLFGVQATDEIDGDITSDIHIGEIVLPDGQERTFTEQLPTEINQIGVGTVSFHVANSFGIDISYVQQYEVIFNEAPSITAPNRYYFVGEYEAQSEKEESQALIGRILFHDDTELQNQLETQCELDVGELNLKQPGEYRVLVKVRDQYGHRYYMPDGKEERYGLGKVTLQEFAVFVTERLNPPLEELSAGYIRFVPNADRTDECEETWQITGEDKKRIKAFVRNRDEPFSRETNQLFYEMFAPLRVQ